MLRRLDTARGHLGELVERLVRVKEAAEDDGVRWLTAPLRLPPSLAPFHPPATTFSTLDSVAAVKWCGKRSEAQGGGLLFASRPGHSASPRPPLYPPPLLSPQGLCARSEKKEGER